MHSLDLPVLSEDAPLSLAFSTLEEHSVSALLVKAGSTWRLLDTAALTRRGNKVDTPLRDLISASPTGREAAEIDTGDDGGALDLQIARVGVAVFRRNTPGAALAKRRLVARDLDLVMRLGQAIRYCTCPDGHVWAPGDPLVAGVCDFDELPLKCR